MEGVGNLDAVGGGEWVKSSIRIVSVGEDHERDCRMADHDRGKGREITEKSRVMSCYGHQVE